MSLLSECAGDTPSRNRVHWDYIHYNISFPLRFGGTCNKEGLYSDREWDPVTPWLRPLVYRIVRMLETVPGCGVHIMVDGRTPVISYIYTTVRFIVIIHSHVHVSIQMLYHARISVVSYLFDRFVHVFQIRFKHFPTNQWKFHNHHTPL